MVQSDSVYDIIVCSRESQAPIRHTLLSSDNFSSPFACLLQSITSCDYIFGPDPYLSEPGQIQLPQHGSWRKMKSDFSSESHSKDWRNTGFSCNS